MPRLLTTVPVAALLIASRLVPAGQSRTDNRSKPIYLVHGYESKCGSNCNQWDGITGGFRD